MYPINEPLMRCVLFTMIYHSWFGTDATNSSRNLHETCYARTIFKHLYLFLKMIAFPARKGDRPQVPI